MFFSYLISSELLPQGELNARGRGQLVGPKGGGVEWYLHNLLPEFVRRGHEVALWHEAKAPSDRAPIALTDGCPAGASWGLGKDALWRASARGGRTSSTHGLGNPKLEEKTLAVAPAVFFAHNYQGTCISGGKSFSFPAVAPCGRRFGPACLGLYYPRRCEGLNPAVMWREYQRQSRRPRILQRYHSLVTNDVITRMVEWPIAWRVLKCLLAPESIIES